MINYSITMRSVNSNLLIGSICHLLIVAYRPLLLYLRNPRAKPFMGPLEKVCGYRSTIKILFCPFIKLNNG